MKKPDIPPMLPGAPPATTQPSQPARAVVHRPTPANTPTNRPAIPPTPLAAHAGGPVGHYVDPYLFETGYYASRAEYNELQRTAASRIRLRAEAENAKPKRHRRG